MGKAIVKRMDLVIDIIDWSEKSGALACILLFLSKDKQSWRRRCVLLPL